MITFEIRNNPDHWNTVDTPADPTDYIRRVTMARIRAQEARIKKARKNGYRGPITRADLARMS